MESLLSTERALKAKSYEILAESVSDVVGRQNLAYIAIKQASMTDDDDMAQEAESLFKAIDISSRKKIRENAVDKANDARNTPAPQLEEDIPPDELISLFERLSAG